MLTLSEHPVSTVNLLQKLSFPCRTRYLERLWNQQRYWKKIKKLWCLQECTATIRRVRFFLVKMIVKHLPHFKGHLK